jgi:HTH-type transcriptional regulator/antitoxin HigA
MSNSELIIDDFYVGKPDTISLEEHLAFFKSIDSQMSTFPPELRTKSTRNKIFKDYLKSKKTSALYRKREDASNLLINYWLSTVKKIALLYGAYNSLPAFETIDNEFVSEIISLSTDINNLTRIGGILEQKGIILIIEKSIPSLKTDGAVFINENGHAVVSLSLRYSRLDNFWFTLVHELSHLILHANQLTDPIIEDLDEEEVDLDEKQANKLAGNLLIPRHLWRNCPLKYNPSNENVLKEFANKVGIHPAIVAGRLRRESKDYSIFSNIVNEIDTREIFRI